MGFFPPLYQPDSVSDSFFKLHISHWLDSPCQCYGATWCSTQHIFTHYMLILNSVFCFLTPAPNLPWPLIQLATICTHSLWLMFCIFIYLFVWLYMLRSLAHASSTIISHLTSFLCSKFPPVVCIHGVFSLWVKRVHLN